ncbi:hypothetical protein EDD15DRAFT_1416460 [Pisolithus albus]|nr:hypothetical protein EDD15DRAFT_1416460 [Pisolithus albus]
MATQSPPEVIDKHPQSGTHPSPHENGVPSSPPSAQAHEQSTPSSSEADREVNPNGSHTVVSSDERDSAKAADKDKSSLAATTNTQPNASLSNTTASTTRRFSRRPKSNRAKPATSADSTQGKSPPVRALSNRENKSTSGSPVKKESFISRLVRKLGALRRYKRPCSHRRCRSSQYHLVFIPCAWIARLNLSNPSAQTKNSNSWKKSKTRRSGKPSSFHPRSQPQALPH